MLGREMRRKLEIIRSSFPDAEITLVGTFAHALAAVNSYPVPEVVLLDLSLPDSSFADTLARVGEIEAQSAVVIVTGHPASKVREILQSPEIEIVEKTPDMLTSNILIAAIVRALTRRGAQETEKLKQNIARMSELLGHATTQ
jgi:DNA-binding NtrC family response regulator